MKVPFVDLVAQWAPLKNDILADWEDILNTAGFVGGARLENFEAELAEFCGTDYAVGVSDGTAALVAILRALDIGPGDKVGVQAETFIATAYAVKQVGAEVVLLDPYKTHVGNIKDLKAFIIVHMYGGVQQDKCRTLKHLTKACGCYLIEDACQAIGCEGVGEYGVATAFSFYPAKNLGCAGQGGAVITNDQAMSIQIRQYINQGWIGNGLHAAEGGNNRLDPIQAAILSRGLKELPKWNDRRREIGAMYTRAFENNDWVTVLDPLNDCVYHLYPIYLNTPSERDALSQYLKDHEIANARHYPMAISQQQGFRTPGFEKLEGYLSCHLTLPIFPTMTDKEVKYVIKTVLDWSQE